MKYGIKKTQEPLSYKVKEVIKAKDKKADITKFEKEIDMLVYKLYEVTDDIVKIIDKEFWLRAEQHDKIKIGEK